MGAMMVLMMINQRQARTQQHQHRQQRQQQQHRQHRQHRQQRQQQPPLLIAAAWVLILLAQCAISQQQQQQQLQQQQQSQQLQQLVQSTNLTTAAAEAPTTTTAAAAAAAAASAVKDEFNGASNKAQQQQQQPVIKSTLAATAGEQQQQQQQQTSVATATRNGVKTTTNQSLSAAPSIGRAAAIATTPVIVSLSSATSSSAASAAQSTAAFSATDTTATTTTNVAQQAATAAAAATTLHVGEQHQPKGNSAESLSVETEDAVNDEPVSPSRLEPTTYRPQQRPPAIAPHTSAQERERKLMNVLAARRSALHRGGFRTRVGTTGRTATAATLLVESSTSKTPTDARTICIRNCTKNFTRRTTASCMRQCANFSRTTTVASAVGPGGTVIVRPSAKSGGSMRGTPPPPVGERDTNEILFTDESSHGLFVVAKELNDTANHIPTPDGGTKSAGGLLANKLRGRGKPAVVVTLAPASIEDDEIQPYLYFGQKLPPLKPATLAITSVSDEHPKLLEVSVVELASTTPATAAATSTLSPVERSRSRYKYNMRERSGMGGGVAGVAGAAAPFNRRYSVAAGVARPATALLSAAGGENSGELRPSALPQLGSGPAGGGGASSTESALDAAPVVSSTPLLISVLNEEEEEPSPPTALVAEPHAAPPSGDQLSAHKRNEPEARRAANSTTTTAAATTTTSTPATPTTTTTTTTMPVPTTSRAPSSTTTSTISATSPRRRPPTTTTTTTTTTSTTTTAAPAAAAPPVTSGTAKPPRNIIEEDTERLRALGPILTQRINTDDKTNLIIFLNRSSSSSSSSSGGETTPKRATTTLRPLVLPNAPTTDSTSMILRTTILTSVRSTVNPRTSSTAPIARGDGGATIVGVVETVAAPALNMDGVAPSPPPPPPPPANHDQQQRGDDDVAIEMHRMNIVTLVLVIIGLFPLLAVVMYLVRNFVMRRHVKAADEDFDVCITDQQPISPVKKLDGKFHNSDDGDEPHRSSDDVDHHQQQLHHQSQAKLRGDNSHVGSGGGGGGGHRYDEHCSVISDQEEFERSNIRLKSLLGEGNFGQVWKAEADDLSGHFGATRIVAVKTIRACSAQVSLKEEANIMRKLGSHHNVVTLLGACVETEPHMIIMEYAMRGRLLSLLRAARSATNILPASVPGGRSLAPLSPRTLAGFALDIACGMEYIAEKRIVHRDLAARNVLLDHNGVCKICDFGMSIDLDAERKRKEQEKNTANEILRSNSQKFKFDFGGRFIMSHWNHGFSGGVGNAPCPAGQQSKEASSPDKKAHGHHGPQGHDTAGKRHALPIRWMAPEALQYHSFTTETDIWAFGIVLWEIATLGSTPYSQLTGREVIRRVPQGARPELPKEGRHEFYNLMARCWHKDPQMRPSFTQSRLEIARSLHKWVDDDAASDYMDVSGFSEDLEHGMVYFNHRISEFECEI